MRPWICISSKIGSLELFEGTGVDLVKGVDSWVPEKEPVGVSCEASIREPVGVAPGVVVGVSFQYPLVAKTRAFAFDLEVLVNPCRLTVPPT